jgi:hypothetical protein
MAYAGRRVRATIHGSARYRAWRGAASMDDAGKTTVYDDKLYQQMLRGVNR